MDDAKYRDLMAAVPAPVTIITTYGHGEPSGSTVSAFASLSLDPKLVMVSMDNRSGLLRRIREHRHFGVNLLAAHQGDLALKFARSEPAERFEGVSWSLDHELPRLDDTAAWMVCSLAYELPAGDHTILAGLVNDAELYGRPAVVYSDRVFGANSSVASFVG